MSEKRVFTNEDDTKAAKKDLIIARVVDGSRVIGELLKEDNNFLYNCFDLVVITPEREKNPMIVGNSPSLIIMAPMLAPFSVAPMPIPISKLLCFTEVVSERIEKQYLETLDKSTKGAKEKIISSGNSIGKH